MIFMISMTRPPHFEAKVDQILPLLDPIKQFIGAAANTEMPQARVGRV